MGKTFRKVRRTNAVVSRDRCYGVASQEDGRVIHFLLNTELYDGTMVEPSSPPGQRKAFTVWLKIREGIPLCVEYDPRTFRLVRWSLQNPPHSQ